MRLTLLEAQYVLRLIEKDKGFGYSDDPAVGKLQAKLSILMELGVRMGDPQSPVIEVKK